MKRRSEGKRFSPHSDMLELLGFHSVFPASAGMIPIMRKQTQFNGRVPRKRGDDPLTQRALAERAGCSPQARG